MTTTTQPSRSRQRGAADARRAGARSRHPSGREPTRKPPGRRSPTFVLLSVVATILTLLGLVMVLSASSVSDLRSTGNSWHSFQRQATWAGIGGAALIVTMRVDYRRWRLRAKPVLVLCLGLLALVLVPGVGVTVNGATRWLGAGPFQIQPAEFAKLGLLLWVCDLLARRWDQMRSARATLRPVLIALGVTSVLLLAQPNLGTTIVISASVLVVLLVAGTPLLRMAGLGVIATGAATVLALGAGYRRDRVLAFLDPWADPLNTGYQTIQSMVGIASGGFTGVGLGASRAKWGFLPFAHTDFIFAIIAEELGLVGAGTVILLFAALGVFGARAAMGAPDEFGMLLATGITTWLVVQAVVNLGAVLGVLPITGVPLPFVSFGGSSLVITMAATGILLNIARQSEL
jgi:cell division protein FtsW